MDSMVSFSASEPSGLQGGHANGHADGPSQVEGACCDILSALKRYSDGGEADPDGVASQEERQALRDLNRAINTARQFRCQDLVDFYAKSLTHEALKIWIPPHDPGMQRFASDLIGDLFNFLEQRRSADKRVAGQASVACQSTEAAIS